MFPRDFREISEFFKDSQRRAGLLCGRDLRRRRRQAGATTLKGFGKGELVRKRTVTTIETHQVIIVRRPAGSALAWCPACTGEVEAASLEEAAVLTGIGLRDLCRRVGSEHVHLVETADGTLVCLASLLKRVSLGDGGLDSDGAEIPPSPPQT